MTTWDDLDEIETGTAQWAMIVSVPLGAALVLLPCSFEKTRLGFRLLAGASLVPILLWYIQRESLFKSPGTLGLLGGAAYNAAAPCSARNKLIAGGIAAGGIALQATTGNFGEVDAFAEISEDPEDIIPQ